MGEAPGLGRVSARETADICGVSPDQKNPGSDGLLQLKAQLPIPEEASKFAPASFHC